MCKELERILKISPRLEKIRQDAFYANFKSQFCWFAASGAVFLTSHRLPPNMERFITRTPKGFFCEMLFPLADFKKVMSKLLEFQQSPSYLKFGGVTLTTTMSVLSFFPTKEAISIMITKDPKNLFDLMVQDQYLETLLKEFSSSEIEEMFVFKQSMLDNMEKKPSDYLADYDIFDDFYQNLLTY